MFCSGFFQGLESASEAASPPWLRLSLNYYPICCDADWRLELNSSGFAAFKYPNDLAFCKMELMAQNLRRCL